MNSHFPRLIMALAILFIGMVAGVLFQKYVSIWKIRALLTQSSPADSELTYPATAITEVSSGLSDSAIAARIRNTKSEISSRIEQETDFRKSAEVESLLETIQKAHEAQRASSTEIDTENYYFYFASALHESGDATDVERTIDAIAELRDYFEDNGIHLIYCLLPNKLDVEIPGLLERSVYTSVSPERSQFLLRLLEQKVDLIDLRYDFGTASLNRRPLYHRYDHHWNPAGMDLAASRLGTVISESFEEWPSDPASRFSRTQAVVTEPHSYVSRLPEGFRFGDLLTQSIHFDDLPVLRNPQSPVILFGDSNLLHLSIERTGKSADFMPRLSQKLGVPLDRLARSAALSPDIITMAQEIVQRSSRPEIVVWIVHGTRAVPEFRFPKGDLTAQSSALKSMAPGMVTGTITHIPTLPDPALSPYAEALQAFTIKVPSPSGDDDEEIQCVTWAFQNRELKSSPWLKVGNRVSLKITDFDAANKESGLDGIMIIDDSELFAVKRFWVVDAANLN